MAGEVPAGGKLPPPTANLHPDLGPQVSATDTGQLKKPSVGTEGKRGSAENSSAGIEGPISTPKHPSRITYKVEYVHESSKRTVFQTDGESHEALRPASTEASIFEVVQVNMTTLENESWDRNRLPPVHRMGTSYIRIFSPAIISALCHVVEYYPGQNFVGRGITITEPYAIIWHHEDGLEKYRENFAPGSSMESEASEACANQNVYGDIGILLDFVRSKYGDAIKKAHERLSEGYMMQNMVWLFLKPGVDVYFDAENTNQYEPYVFKSTNIDMANGEIYGYEFSLWNLRGESKYIRPTTTTSKFFLAAFETPISKLMLIPCECLERNEGVKIMGRTGKELRKFFEERGRAFVRLRRKGCFGFDGVTTTQPIRPYVGQVMVDPEQWAIDRESSDRASSLFSDYHLKDAVSAYPICSCRRCTNLVSGLSKRPKFGKYYLINGSRANTLSPHEYFLCHGTIEAFLFKTREWATLDVLEFRDPVFDGSILNDLVMPKETKSMITKLTKKYVRSLIAKNEEDEAKKEREEARTEDGKAEDKENEAGETQNHGVDTRGKVAKPDPAISSIWSADFVSGKGEGLIFLLHGKPGVGKTYTAECVAAHTERPLLSLTCADIGTDPVTVEKRLQRWFKIAASWGAIMLIDEADIYMEHRQVQDLARNNLVAGFLRALEYYKGILFLTTNRVGAFDEAFISRIHIMIHYPPFTDKDREEVWENFFTKLENEQGENMKILESTRDYVTSEEVQGLKWNGREIRNAFQIAVALAQAEEDRDKRGRIQVRREHIKSTVRMSKTFKDYLNKLYMKDETQRAAMMGNRLDSYGDEKPGENRYT